MKINKLTISKEIFSLMPEREQVLFVQTSNILNDINMLHKQALYSSKICENDLLQKAQNSLAFFNFKILAGKLFEAWEVVRTGFLSNPDHKVYLSSLDDYGKECLEKLKAYFNKQNLILFIRNKCAFHYDAATIKEQLDSARLEEFEIYLSEYQGNALYFMSIILESTAIFNYIDSSNMENAADILFKETLEVSTWFQGFIQNCLIIILRDYFTPNQLVREELEIPEPPDIRDVHLPFFVKKSFKGIIL